MKTVLVVLCFVTMACAQFPGGPPSIGGPPPIMLPPGGGAGAWLGNNRNAPVCPPFGIFQRPDFESCSRFILCRNGIAKPHNCSEGTHFNIERGICINRDEADCNLCRFNNQQVRFFPVEESCTKYHVCFQQERVERECTGGLYYNPRINKCDRADNVDCQVRSSSRLTRSCPQSSNRLSFLPDLETCNNYFICNRGEPELHDCGPNMVFNIDQNRCTTHGRCILDFVPTCPSQNTPSFLPHPYDCRHFFFCNNGQPTLDSCGAGLLFDIASNQCNKDAVATCATPIREQADQAIWPSL